MVWSGIKMYTTVSAPITFTQHRYTNKANVFRRNYRPIKWSRHNLIYREF